MADILLATLNARYIHSAFGLRYLLANLGDLQPRAEIIEFEVSQEVSEIVERILLTSPTIVGLGVYIWNITKTTEVVTTLKRVAPHITVVIGGPEVSFDSGDERIVKESDFVVAGEGEFAFRALCREILFSEPTNPEFLPVETVPLGSNDSHTTPNDHKFRTGGLPPLEEVQLPYSLYSEQDLKHRVVYIEASRGCPFTCEFCLSSVDVPVRAYDTDRILAELEMLYKRGLRTFKFVDRTFNLNIRTASRILQFFLDRMQPGLFVHFEMVPDRFPSQLRELVKQFPEGSLQFEVGIQSFNPEVGKNISRRQDFPKISENLTFLRKETGVYIHADLIVGLPGEDLASFASGFDTLVALDPHEIQVGILKRLKGTPIVRHDDEFLMRYSATPPYEILSNAHLSFFEVQKMRRFARFWDLIANSGNFIDTKKLIWEGTPSPFSAFLELTEWLFSELGRKVAVSLKSLSAHLFIFLTEVRGLPAERVGRILAEDYLRGGRRDLPDVLTQFMDREEIRERYSRVRREAGVSAPERLAEASEFSDGVPRQPLKRQKRVIAETRLV